MKHIRKIAVIALSCILLLGCSSSHKEGKPKTSQVTKDSSPKNNSSFTKLLPSIVKIESFDHNRFLESETAFFVGEHELICRLSVLKNATHAKITPFNTTKKYTVTGYLAVDRINDLVLLQVENILAKPILLYPKVIPNSAKSIYLSKPQNNTLPLHRGKVLNYTNIAGVKRYVVNNQFRSKSYGTPVFISNKQSIGLGYSELVNYEQQQLVIPSIFIISLLNKKADTPQSIANLKAKVNKETSTANSKIKGLLIDTDYGEIQIRLFNETPAYRDNFIRLVRENYYDSLLIHRVIKGFCIQSGAADTRYAEADDIVGWKGPGYSIPAHIIPHLFHKRGMIGAPRKPDRGNNKRRSDGSQFYIVTGRTYSDSELNEIETENNYTFSAKQRQAYKTIGGAPHIDGTYTIFGEVVHGLEVADMIVQLKTDTDFRPAKDIRIKKITIIK